MTKRTKILLAFASGLVLVVVLCAIFPPDPEPSYEGSSLSTWVGLRGGATRCTYPYYRERAMRHMGTKAIPYLLRWIEEVEPRRKGTFREKIAPMVAKAGMAMPTEYFYDDAVFGAAFSYLGPDAQVAIPHLANLMQTSTSEVVVKRAANCLTCLGEKGVPPFIEVITNQTAKFRPLVIYLTIGFGTNAAPLIPGLIQCLKDQDPDVVECAARALGELHLRPDLVVPALAAHQHLPNSTWTCQMPNALGFFGPSAKAAIPALLQALDAQSQDMRESARKALQKIDPEALKRATNGVSP